ncbi:hypothetical protein BD289DRAFT_450447 [Coniella lustricola]|uniref:SET domain-containing protein n=1 Tax=Coniella lustricola TaxID=2025994 RepID=A0A2T3AIC7_9PEZI|nr:hypothetical protein BD289DRAFT_450447 [Coniella lustricola]
MRTSPVGLRLQSQIRFGNFECEEHKSRGPPYQLLDSPGKGRGLFATKVISKDEAILEEKTILACGNEGPKGGWKFGPEDLQNFAGQLISLSPQLQTELFKLEGKQLLTPPLMNHYSRILNEHVYHSDGSQLSWRESLRLQDALRIFYTNAATLYEPDATWSNLRPAEQEVGDGLFLTFSRINHSCEPNAVWDTGHLWRRDAKHSEGGGSSVSVRSVVHW